MRALMLATGLVIFSIAVMIGAWLSADPDEVGWIMLLIIGATLALAGLILILIIGPRVLGDKLQNRPLPKSN